MKTVHAKSPCCGAQVYRFGRKRRQCSQCLHTWTLRPKKRGRPSWRIRPSLLRRILLGQQNLGEVARRARPPLTRQALSYRFRRTLQWFVTRPDLRVYPSGELVLLTDGLWFRFRRRRWILYLTALKPCRGNYAIFLDPLLLEGREGLRAWRKLVQAIPPEPRTRIRAWVSDHAHGINRLARENGWILQLCHFHLISQLQARRGHWKPGIGSREFRESLYQLIREMLEASEERMPSLQKRLESQLKASIPTLRLGMVAREFLRSLEHYRAYRRYPELGLPTTTNTVESMARIIRDLLRRVRSLPDAPSLQLWITALIRMRPRVTCNGKHFQQN